MAFELRGKKITIIGLARSGVAVVNAVHQRGGMPKISEFKPRAEVEDQLKALPLTKITFEFGGHTQNFIEDSDYLVLSPGVRLDIPPVQWAKSRGIEVMGEIEFAYRLCPCPIVAVTGSNGKTTTSTLIAEILKKAGRRAVLCGNIGSPFSKHVLDLKQTDTVVLEISSFQLESTAHFKPHVAVWLNFSQNHLDRHKDLQEYFDAKKKILANQDASDYAVLNALQPEFKELSQELKANIVWFGQDKPAGIDNPNYLAAMAAAQALGIGEDVCRQVFAEFKGVEHRLELVCTLQSVDYINDSKSTTAEAGRWALERLHKPIVMICGGRDKHIDFSVLRSLVQKKVKHMIAIGEARDIMKNTFGDLIPVDTFTSLETAINAAKNVAKEGDCIVLSPMCASFDMFQDYEHRGRVFKEIVNSLN
jgi:UDP-N-acetylmuramoylalanine--D-glutamate ligase